MRYGVILSRAATIAALLLLLHGPASHAARPDWAGYGPPPATAVGLKNFPFDTTTGPPAVPPGLSRIQAAPGAGRFAIVKFRDRQNQADRRRLEGLGVRFYGYVPVNGFFAKIPAGLRPEVESDPSVEFVGDYLPAYRLDTVPLGWAVRGERGPASLVVQIFDDEPAGPVIEALEGLGGTIGVMSDRPGLNGKFLKLSIDKSRVAEAASVEGVQWIEEELVPKLHNDLAAPVTNVSAAWSRPVPLKGTGQVVAMCDSGLDTGNTATLHPDFMATTSDGKAKLKQTFAYGRTNDWSDPHGHGTHTCGSSVGAGVVSNQLMPGTYIRGMAYDAQLVMQSVLNAGGGLSVPALNTVVFPDAYNAGARVHSDSWGYTNSAGLYAYPSMQADTYLWSNKDLTVVFSAGNDAVDADADGIMDTGSISPPSTAKDVIAVGASENNRPNITTTYNTAWPGAYKPPVSTDRLADNVNGMSAFSSRGPCVDGRIKPDVVAPGTYILSTRSSLAPDGNYWRKASTTGSYSTSLDPYYAADGGTSMATPIVAGAAAVVRQALHEGGEDTPSAALVKAIIVTGAFDMTPGQYNPPKNDVTARPDVNQGWGRLDLKGSLFPDAPYNLVHVDEKQGLSTGSSNNYQYSLVSASVPLRVSLVWNDYPGSTATVPNLVNDLDLVVTTPGGTVYHGNMYSGSASVPNDSGFDRLNNVEGVTVPAASLATGSLTVSVSAYNVPQGPQPYALVISGGLGGPPVVNSVDPSSGPDDAPSQITVTGSGFEQGCSVKVGSVDCAVGTVTSTSIAATVPAGVAPGVYDVTVTNTGGVFGRLASGYTVLADSVPPSAPQGLSASPGDTTVNLGWTVGTEPDLAGYRVYFNTYSTAIGKTSPYKLTGLTNGMNYDIYMRAVDVAGNESAASATVSATPFAAETELPHYNWDGSPAWLCDSCHISSRLGSLLPTGFDYHYDQELCLSCHNTSSVAHDTPIKSGRSHTVMANVTSGGARMPTSGFVTVGEYSDAMFGHLEGGNTIVCVTCHNTMQKLHDAGRYWEVLHTQDNAMYSSSRGGWWDREYAKVKAYADSSLWTPQYSKDREKLRLADNSFTYDELAGRVAFSGSSTLYVYLSLDDPYLRADANDNTACTDCHAQLDTHRSYSCLRCHEMHGESGTMNVRKNVRRPAGSSAPVVFTGMTGAGSFADGDGVYDGICEVCHTTTNYYRSDGSVLNNHTSTGLDYSGKDCTACHTHQAGFSP